MAFRLPSLSPVAWVTFEKVTQQVLWLILFAVLAPILGPRPYGLFSIVMVFVGICELILLEGAVEALVTIDDLEHLHTTTANTANGGLALALALVLSALAPLIGKVFQDDEITWLIWTLAPLPLLSSLSATPIATLRRAMDYRRLAIRSIIGLFIGGVFGIVLAIGGAGVWALVMQVIAQRFAEFVIAWISAPVRFGVRWSGPHFRELSPIAVNVYAGRMMTVAGGQLPRVILGYMLGATELGLFTLASRFQEIIIQTAVQPIAAVGRIELRHSKPGTPEFENEFARVTQNIALLSFPMFIGAAVLTPDLFQAWLDHRWAAGVIPMQLILLGGVPLAIFYCIDAAFFAANQSRLFAWTATVQTLTISLAVLCVAPWGLNLTALALAVRPWVLLPIFLLLLHRSCQLPILRTLSAPLLSLIGAVIMGIVLSTPYMHPAWLHHAPTLVLLVLVGMALYAAFLYGFLWAQVKTLMSAIFINRT